MRIGRLGRRVARAGREALGSIGVLHRIQRRSLDICCCGLSKTGTHSMAGLFSDYRSGHHADADRTLDLAIGLLEQTHDHRALVFALERRDKRLWLEMESSSMLGILVAPLVDACPDKRFILTLRDPHSWFNSWADHHINKPPSRQSKFARLDRIRLRGEDHPHTRFDQVLLDLGMESLSAHLALWADHNVQVLETVPVEKLLIVKTTEILDRQADIARFAGVRPTTLRPEQGWQFAAPQKHDVLSRLDPVFVSETTDRYCRGLLQKYFPEMNR